MSLRGRRWITKAASNRGTISRPFILSGSVRIASASLRRPTTAASRVTEVLVLSNQILSQVCPPTRRPNRREPIRRQVAITAAEFIRRSASFIRRAKAPIEANRIQTWYETKFGVEMSRLGKLVCVLFYGVPVHNWGKQQKIKDKETWKPEPNGCEGARL